MASKDTKDATPTAKKAFNPAKRKRYFNADNPQSKPTNNKSGSSGQEVIDLSNVDFSSFKSSNRRKKQKTSASQYKPMRKQKDPFPGDAPIPKQKIKKYERGDAMLLDTIKTKQHRNEFRKKEHKLKDAAKKAARTELLLTDEAGFIEDETETLELTQQEIADSVDILSAQKYFDLNLDKFGPYKINYTRNGRFLLIGGGKGHVAAMDWQRKKLMCEINVMETVNDVKWLHIETMFAVAQKKWLYIYDNQGIELHCLKRLSGVRKMEFLPYHFLLATGSDRGFLTWLDVSVGKIVSNFHSKCGIIDVMCQNPRNAILHCGTGAGRVTLWSPNVKEPLVSMLCHYSATRAVAVSNDGLYMATSGVDRKMKIWDLRTYKPLQAYTLKMGSGHLAFSQRNLLAAGIGNTVEVPAFFVNWQHSKSNGS